MSESENVIDKWNFDSILTRFNRSKIQIESINCTHSEIYLTVNHFLLQFLEGSTCVLHTGDMGICKIADNCKWLAQNLQKKKMKFSDIRRCTFTVTGELNSMLTLFFIERESFFIEIL